MTSTRLAVWLLFIIVICEFIITFWVLEGFSLSCVINLLFAAKRALKNLE